MEKKHLDKMAIKRGDITKEEVDVIVNAANSSLLGGGGVDGAIHRAAGPDLLTECIELRGCEPGEAKWTGGYKLPARFIVHTVGPIWRGGKNNEDEILANAYRNSLKESVRIGAKTVSFPAISTGVYGFPADRAAKIAVNTVADFLKENEELDEVRFVCFSEESEKLHAKELALLKEA
jgi:O-acetyl-ADP-ribose deacetylase (regulator of RNase III)